MKTHNNTFDFTSTVGTVVTIGTFDGVHLGHKKIIDRLTAYAQSHELKSVVLTFFPHPRMVLQRDSEIKLINTILERRDLLAQSGLDHLVIHPFTKDFASYDAESFVEEFLVNALNAKHVIIGYDHRFGRNRAANIDDLRIYGKKYGFTVEEISKKEQDDVAISSTKIRNAIIEGDISKANTYLGAPFFLTGTVVKGKQLGRTLGFPTANLALESDYKIIPTKGVYIVEAIIEGSVIYGMMNIGTNPTVNGSGLTIETHFFDFDKDIYHHQLVISLLYRVRNEKKFVSLAALKEAMIADETFSRKWISTHITEYVG